MTDGQENKYSLETDILLNFSNAEGSIAEATKKLGLLNTAFKELSDAAADAGQDIGTKVANRIEKLYAQIKEAEPVKVNSKQIREKIQEAVVSAMLKADIHIQGMDTKTLDVVIDKETQNKLEAKIRHAVTAAAAAVEFKPFEMTTIKLAPAAMSQLKSNFSKFLHEQLDEKVNFQMPKNVKGEERKLKLEVKGEHVQSLLDAYQKWAINLLSDGTRFDIGELNPEPMKIRNETIQLAYQTLAKKAKELIAGVHVDPATLAGLKDVQIDSEGFNKKIKTFSTHILAINEVLKNLDLKADENDLRAFLTGMKSVKADLVQALTGFMDSVEAQLKKDLPKAQAAEYSEQLKRIVGKIDTGIKSRLDVLETVSSAMVNSSNLQETVSKLMVSYNAAITKTIQTMAAAQNAVTAFEQTAATAVAEAMKNVDVSDAKAINLNDEVNKALEKAESAVMSEILKWNPDIKPFDIDLDTNVMKPVADAIEAATKEMISSVAARLGGNLADKVVQEVEQQKQAKPKEQKTDKPTPLRKLKNFSVKTKLFGDLNITKFDSIDDMVDRVRKDRPEWEDQTDDEFWDNWKQKVQGASAFAHRDNDIFLTDVMNKRKESDAHVKAVIAHEIGHKVDPKFQKFIREKGITLDRNTYLAEIEAAARASKLRRDEWYHIDNYTPDDGKSNVLADFFGVTRDPEKERRHMEYVKSESEMFADAFAAYTQHPAKARKLMPNVAKIFDQMDIGLELFDKPMKAAKAVAEPTAAEKKKYQELFNSVHYIGNDHHRAAYDEHLKEMMEKYPGTYRKMFEEESAKAPTTPKLPAQPSGKNDLAEIDASIGKYVSNVVRAAVASVNNLQTNPGEFRVAIKDLDSEVRKIIAENMDISVADLRKQKELTGQEGLDAVTQANMEAVFKKFHAVLGDHATQIVGQYKDALSKVPVSPDLSAVSYLVKRFDEIQGDIAKKVRELLDAQFNKLAEEIKKIQAQPVSLGYSAPAVPSITKGSKTGSMAAAISATGPSRYRSVGSGYYTPDDRSTGTYNSGRMRNPGGDTKTFMGSVENTMRYIIAGSLIGLPYMAYQEAWESAKEFDYQMAKAQQNFLAQDPGMEETARKRIATIYANWDELTNVDAAGLSPKERQKREENRALLAKDGITSRPTSATDSQAITGEAARLKYKADGGSVKALQDAAIAYSVDTQDVATAFQVASMGISDPNEALEVAKSAALIKSTEDETNVEDNAKGLQSVMAQWGLNGYKAADAGNMMVLAANTNLTTVKDLLEIQKRSGAIFANNLPGMDKRTALATSIGLSSLYTEATARAGAQGGTFFRNVLTSPFGGTGKDTLEEMAKNPDFKFLDPFKEEKNAQGQTVKLQKNGLDMLVAITDAWGKIDDEQKNVVSDKIFKQWFKGDAQAMIGALRADLDEATKDGKLQASGGAQALFGNLMQDPAKLAESVAMISAGMQDTWKFRTQRVRTEWQASTFEIFDNMKDEFGTVANQISVFLRLVRENAGMFAQGITMLGKIGIALGARFLVNKGVQLWNNHKEEYRQRELAPLFDEKRHFLNEEGRAVNMRAIELSDRRAVVGSRYEKVEDIRNRMNLDGKREHVKRLEQEIEEHQAKLERMDDDDQHDEDQYNELLKAPDKETDLQRVRREDKLKKITDRRADRALQRDAVSKGRYAKEDELRQTQDAITRREPREAMLAEQSKRMAADLRTLEKEMKLVDDQAVSLNNQMDALDIAMHDEGVEAKRLSNSMNRVATGFRGVDTSGTMFKNALQDYAKSMKMSEQDTEKFVTSMQRLDREFKTTKMDAAAYFAEVQKIQRAHQLSSKDVLKPNSMADGAKMGPLATEASYGMDLFDILATYGAVKGAKGLATAGKKGNLISRAWAALRGGKGAATAAEAATGAAGALKSTKGLAPILGPLLKGIKGIPLLGTALVGMDVMSNLIMPWKMTNGEKQNQYAGNLSDLANSIQTIDGMAWYNPMKYVFGLGEAGNAVSDSIIHWMGGTTASAKDHGKAIAAMLKFNGEDLGNALNSEQGLNYSQLSAESQRMITDEQLKNDKTIDIDGDGRKGDTNYTNFNQLKSFEDGQQMLMYLQQLTQTSQQNAQSNFDVTRTNMMINGVREDSKEMRDLLAEFFTKNIEALNTALYGQKDANGNVTLQGIEQKKALIDPIKQPDVWAALDAQEQQYKSQLAGYQLQAYQNQTSVLDETLSEMNRDVQNLQSKYAIKKDDAILGGAAEDSTTVQGIDSEAARTINARMAETKSELSKLLDEYKDNETMRRQIEDAMLQIDVESKNNLVGIRKALEDQKSTFNLPEGVQPMTYWESKAKEGTHSSISIGTGDTIVNIIADKINSDAAGLQKIGEAVAGAVKKASTSVSRELSQQVKTGIQNNYRGV